MLAGTVLRLDLKVIAIEQLFTMLRHDAAKPALVVGKGEIAQVLAICAKANRTCRSTAHLAGTAVL
jgi:hypothetical protein